MASNGSSVRSFTFISAPPPPTGLIFHRLGGEEGEKTGVKVQRHHANGWRYCLFFYDRKHRPHAFFQEEIFDVVGHRGCLFYLQNENQSISPDQSRWLFTCQRSWFLRPQRRHFQHRLANTQTCVCDVYRSWPEVPPWGVEFRHEKVTVQTPIRARS